MMSYGEGFAQAYDHFWAAYPRRMAQLWLELHRRVAPGAQRSLLDVGCGTGIVAQHFQAEGYSVMGVDVSAAMLSLAREKLGPQAVLLEADAADFEVPSPSAFAVSNYDIPNHLGGLDRVRGYLRSVHGAVVPGGWFGFDLSTTRGLAAKVEPVSLDDGGISVAVHRGELTGDSLPLHISGELRTATGTTVFRTTIGNTAYPVNEIVDAAAEAGWIDLSVVSSRDLTTPVADPEAETRVAIIARRA